MKKIFVMTMLLMLCFSKNTIAQENVVDLFAKDTALEETISSDSFSGPEGTFTSVKELRMPQCHDEEFRQKITDRIKFYQENNKETTILGKRKQFLMLKRIRDFEEVSPEGIDSKKDYDLANEIIKTKINLGVTTTDMRLCRCTKSVDDKDLYVLMYERNNLIYGKIINFETEGVNEEQLSFVEGDI